MYLLTLLPILIFTKSTFGIDRSQFFEGGTEAVLSKDEAYVGTRLPNFKFFGNTFNRIFVGDNGILSFLEGIDYFISGCFDIQGNVDGSMFIAPFWSEVNPEMGGLISYSVNVDVKSLEKANSQLQAAFPSSTPHNMHWVFVATWLDVHPRGHNASNTHCRNTFQTILTSDGTRSYVIFYYETLNWITGKNFDGICSAEAHGSATAGFYAGHKIHQGEIQLISPASCTLEVRELASSSNVGQNGVWVFKVDKALEVPKLQNARKPRQINPYAAQEFPKECPKAKDNLCKSTTPCRAKIVELVEYLVKFIRDFPSKCLNKEPGTGNPPQEPTDPPGYPPEPTDPPGYSPPEPSSSPRYPEDPYPTEPPWPEYPEPTHPPTRPPPPPTPPPTPPPPLPTEAPNVAVECPKTNDIGILVEGCKMTGSNNYQLALAFIDKLVAAFVQTSRIQLYYFCQQALVQVRIDNTFNPGKISDLIKRTPFLNTQVQVQTPQAILIAGENMRKKKRPGVPQKLIVLAGNNPSVAFHTSPKAVRNMGVDLYAVGIGNGISYNQLLEMALQEDRVITVGSYNELDQLLNKVSKTTCN